MIVMSKASTKKYKVEFTKTFTEVGYLTVDATSEDEAEKIALQYFEEGKEPSTVDSVPSDWEMTYGSAKEDH